MAYQRPPRPPPPGKLLHEKRQAGYTLRLFRASLGRYILFADDHNPERQFMVPEERWPGLRELLLSGMKQPPPPAEGETE